MCIVLARLSLPMAEKGENMYPINRREIKSLARMRIRTARPSPLAVGAAYFIITWVISLVATRLQATAIRIDWDLFWATGDATQALTIYPERITFLYQLLVAAIDVVSLVIGVGMTLYALRVMRGDKAGVGDLFDSFSLFFKIVWLNLLMSVYVFLWSLLLFIPGIIAAYSYSMAIYLLLDHPDWRVGQCIRESKRLMKGHKGEIFMLDLSFFGWYLLTAIPVVQIYVTPYVQLARAEFYNRLVGCSTAAEEEKAPWEY